MVGWLGFEGGFGFGLWSGFGMARVLPGKGQMVPQSEDGQ